MIHCPPTVSIQELREACDYLLIPFTATIVKCHNIRKWLMLWAIYGGCCVANGNLTRYFLIWKLRVFVFWIHLNCGTMFCMHTQAEYILACHCIFILFFFYKLIGYSTRYLSLDRSESQNNHIPGAFFKKNNFRLSFFWGFLRCLIFDPTKTIRLLSVDFHVDF